MEEQNRFDLFSEKELEVLERALVAFRNSCPPSLREDTLMMWQDVAYTLNRKRASRRKQPLK